MKTATLPPRSLEQQYSIPRSVLFGALLLSAAVAGVTLLRHWSFLSTAYDMAFYTHIVSQISRGEWLNTMFGFHVFADHFSPILILVAPVAWWSPAEGLLIVQAVAVGSAVIPAYRLGRAVAGDRAGMLAALWFALSATVWHTLLFDFRPATLGVVAMMWLVAELEGRERLPAIVTFALLAAASREDVAVLAGLILVIHGTLRRQRRDFLLGVGTGAVGIWYTLAGHRLFAPFEYFLSYRYADYGRSPVELLANLDYALPTAMERLVRPDPLIAFAALVVPTLVIAPFVGWKRSWPALLIFVSNGVSADPLVASIHYQYYMAAVVFVIWGSAYGFRRSSLMERRNLSVISALAIFLVVGPLGIVMPTAEGRSIASVLGHLDRASIAKVLVVIPEEATVSAGHYLLPHLASRPEIKPFPSPLVCSPVLLTYYPWTSYPDYLATEARDLAHLNPESYGYTVTRSGQGVTVWASSGDHPEPIKCSTVEDARLGMFERVERYAGK